MSKTGWGRRNQWQMYSVARVDERWLEGFDCLTLGHLLSLSYVLLSRDKRPTNGHTSTPSPSFGCRSVPVSLFFVSGLAIGSFLLSVSECLVAVHYCDSSALAPSLSHYHNQLSFTTTRHHISLPFAASIATVSSQRHLPRTVPSIISLKRPCRVLTRRKHHNLFLSYPHATLAQLLFVLSNPWYLD